MTEVENHHHHAHVAPSDAYYDSDDVGGPSSPQMNAVTVDLQPSSTPPYMVPQPPALSPVSSSGSPGRKISKPTASKSDVGLVSMMGNGNIDVAQQAGVEVLAAADENDTDEAAQNGTVVCINIEDDKSEEGTAEGQTGSEKDASEKGEAESNDLALVAAKAMNVLVSISPPPPKLVELKDEKLSTEVPPEKESTEKARPVERRPTIPSIFVANSNAQCSSDGGVIGLDRRTSVTEELPPIRHHSPSSALSNGIRVVKPTLPSLSDSLKSIAHEPLPPVQSPPARQPPLFSAVSNHGSPPKSPNDTFRRELPSPGRAAYYPYNSHRRPSQTQSDGIQYSSAADYSSSNTETPSTDASATPAIDRMSIDGITNPQIGGFHCTYPGCTAQPFQTQYLLNSHANVHSSNRPHYCSVKGCPRSEGGKGFKRKNEMIRHGLVHDSPGYVCPFCPDREHKYPRPDNLQRHVRVHHVDKDKDDPQLRDVLSQRPEGPSRGRRRRGGNS
ncbi:hypothetical protein HYFRA_00012971 [Hymenoscyphus fraxineus]|uniref:C2H2-type domain-containing protein n=1 Tax=Hymenoscyphus fraxineus TaxID=746836 RepID=A0A9N9PXQ5_9HELO|nr:hypothetical protein HYFRA_00012971 [Hymenoscyphus fraxineus]